MNKILTLILITAAASGCTQDHKIDLNKVKDFESFQWNGTIRVRNAITWLLDTPGIDRIELDSRDGRTVLIVTDSMDGMKVRAYLEVKVEPIENPATQPTPGKALKSVDVQEEQ